MTMSTFLDAGILKPVAFSLITKELRESPPKCDDCKSVLSIEDETRKMLPDGALCCDFCVALYCTNADCLMQHENRIEPAKNGIQQFNRTCWIKSRSSDRFVQTAPFDPSSWSIRQRYGWACPICWGNALEKVHHALSLNSTRIL